MSFTKNYDQSYRLRLQLVGSSQYVGYNYDAADNLQTTYEQGTRAYIYDPLNRLIIEAGGPTRVYAYDAVGNRTHLQDYGNANYAPLDYHYDLSNQHLLNTVSNGNTVAYTTNAQGHINQIGSRNLNYAADQRLSSVSQAGATLGNYGYDAFGRRIAKTIAAGTTRYAYDLSDRLLSETKDSTVQHYAYLDGEPLARIDGTGSSSNLYYFLNNHLGEPLKVRNQAGQLVWDARLDPFGQATTVNPNIVQNLRFPGQYYDAETGWHYNMQRYYNPGTGRYLQSDPIGLAGGINTYTYVSNNPVNLIDPEGLEETGLNQICAANGQGSSCSTGMRAPPPGSPMNGPLSPVGGAATAGEAGLAFIPGAKVASLAKCPLLGKPLYRSMSKAEAEAVKQTGLLRGGKPGETFFTDSRFRSANTAQDRLSLPNRPEVQMEFQIKNDPNVLRNGTRVDPAYGGNGGGREYMTTDPVQVEIINVQPYR